MLYFIVSFHLDFLIQFNLESGLARFSFIGCKRFVSVTLVSTLVLVFLYERY